MKKILYFECNMGAAGDMLNAAMYDLLDDADKVLYLEKMNGLMPGVSVTAEPSVKCGVAGTHIRVVVNGEEEQSLDVHEDAAPEIHTHPHDHDDSHNHNHDDCHDHGHGDHDHDVNHHHHHTSMAEIESLIRGFDLPEDVKENALGVYKMIAAAEAKAHGMPVSEVHFHEVGSKDAVADVTGACLLLHMIAPDEVYCSPLPTGSGEVRCMHGILPVPAPATANILMENGIPFYSGSVRGELLTPTGAALLARFILQGQYSEEQNDRQDEEAERKPAQRKESAAKGFGPMPVMTVRKIGIGCGTKDFEQANIVRALLGETADEAETRKSFGASCASDDTSDASVTGEDVVELVCNLDDMTAEEIAFAAENLRDAGALEVYTTAVTMKKGRQGTLLTCLSVASDKDRFAKLIFENTTTLGVRMRAYERYKLDREAYTAGERDGVTIRGKRSTGFGVVREKLEYDDMAKVARAEGITLREARARCGRDSAVQES